MSEKFAQPAESHSSEAPFSGTKFERAIEEQGLAVMMRDLERHRVAHLSDGSLLTLPGWLETSLDEHEVGHDISSDKWCNRIAHELSLKIEQGEIGEEDWGVEADVISGEYKSPSQEGYAFHSILLLSVSRFSEEQDDFTPSEFYAVDMTAPTWKKGFEVMVVSSSERAKLFSNLKALYGTNFS